MRSRKLGLAPDLQRFFAVLGLSLLLISSLSRFGTSLEGEYTIPLYVDPEERRASPEEMRGLLSGMAGSVGGKEKDHPIRGVISLKTSKRLALSLPVDLSPDKAGRLAVAKHGDPVNLVDYDELWLDYHLATADRNAGLALTLPLIGFDSGGTESGFEAEALERSFFAVEDQVSPVGDWVPKDWRYIGSRIFRKRPDNIWRYTHVGDTTVVQRRFHRDLSGVGTIDVEFDPEIEISGVNLKIGFADNFSPGVMVEANEIHSLNSATRSSQIRRIDVRGFLQKRFPDKDKAYLQEVMIFLKYHRITEATLRPIHKVVFQELVDKGRVGKHSEDGSILKREKDMSFPLLAKTENLSLGNKRLRVDLKGLHLKGDAFFSHLLIHIPEALRTKVHIRGARLIRSREITIPAFMSAGEELIGRWGGPFLNSSLYDSRYEWPDVLGYFPFRASLNEQRPGRVTGKPLKIGAVSVDASEALAASPSVDGAGIAFKGDQLKLTWAIDRDIPAGAVFFMGGTFGHLQGGQGRVKFVFRDGNSREIGFGLNEPVPLSFKGRISHLLVQAEFDPGFHEVNLRELALFRPSMVSVAEAFRMKLPAGAFESIGGLTALGGWFPSASKLFSAADILDSWGIATIADSSIEWGNPGNIHEKILAGTVSLAAGRGAFDILLRTGQLFEPIRNRVFSLDSVEMSVPREVAEKMALAISGQTKRSGGGSSGLKWLWSGTIALVFLGFLFFRASLARFGSLLRQKICVYVPKTDRDLFLIWFSFSIIFYYHGWGYVRTPWQNLSLACAGVCVLLCSRYAFELIRTWRGLSRSSNSAWEWAGAQSVYCLCGIFFLLLAAVFKMQKIRPISEHFAEVAYYGLLVGTIVIIFQVFVRGVPAKK